MYIFLHNDVWLPIITFLEVLCMHKLTAFSYFGGKNSQLGFILPNLPASEFYIEPFGGSAAVLLNREPAKNEVYNDLYLNCVNFFRVLRDHPDELITRLKLTPNSKHEYAMAIDMNKGLSQVDDMIERARMWFMLPVLGFYGRHKEASNWGRAYSSANGMNGMCSKWITAVDRLYPVAERLRRVVIECADAREVIERWDRPEALFYLDPPYVLASRSSKTAQYQNEMNDRQHTELLELCQRCKGRVAISGYDSELYTMALSGWRVVKAPPKVKPSSCGRNGTGDTAVEVLWMNYDAEGCRL